MSTLASFYAGFVIDDLMAVDDFRAQTAVVAATTGAGFAASLLATRGKVISDGMAEAYTLGLWSGLANGLLVAPALGIETDGYPDDGSVNQLYLGFGLATMAVGGATGMVLAERNDITRAKARFASLMGINGFATLGLGLAVVQPDFGDDDDIVVPALMALGLDAGIAIGASVVPRLDWSCRASPSSASPSSWGRSVASPPPRSSSAATPTMMIIPSASPPASSSAACAWTGFGLGTYFTRDMAPDAPFAKTPTPTITVAPTGRERRQSSAASSDPLTSRTSPASCAGPRA